MISDAVGSELISKIVGYKIVKGNFQNTTPNLPQRIAIIGEANIANQATLDTDPFEFTNAQQVGDKYGYGSPLYLIARILRPVQGGGKVGGIPTIIYPQAGDGNSKIVELSPTGTATGNGVHTVVIGGRYGLDGESYDIQIEDGDAYADITAKIADAVNNVLGCPVTADDYDPTKVVLETKWGGLTANELSVSVDTHGNDLGITYSTNVTQPGFGTPTTLQSSLDMFLNEWNTIVVNSYGTNSTIMNTLETFNGIPDPTTPTGRYSAILMKPFIALTGSVADDPSSITDAKKNNVTIAICPAPLSAGFHFEAAANMAALFSRVSQDTPHLDVAGMNYPDMPTPLIIGSMVDYTFRDSIVKKGCSTVDLKNGAYEVQDFVTTYHPVGEIPPQFRYCRNIMLDWNVRYGYYLLELLYVVNHAIANDDDVVTATKVVKPKQWIGVLNKYADDLATRALIAEPSFMQSSLTVGISTSNPDRFETFFRYKRTGFVRIASTTAEAGFNFGTV